MANFDRLSARAFGDVIDALEDAAENYTNAANASDPGSEAEKHFIKLASRFDDVADKAHQKRDLNGNDINLIVEALRRSQENCVELDLTDAAESYEQSITEVLDLNRV